MRRHQLLSGAILACWLALGPVQAKQLRYDNGIPENHVLNTGLKQFAAALPKATGGELRMQHFYGALQSLGEAAIGTRDGVLDMGGAAPQYLPGEFPVNSFISRLPGHAKSSVAMTGADTEFVLLHCKPCMQEFLGHNQVPLVMFSNPTYELILGKRARQVRDPEDIKGLRLRAGGDYFRDWIEYFGAVPVSVQGSETFEAMNSGILDGTTGAMTDVSGFKLAELVSSVTMIDIGAWHSASLFNIRKDYWQSLPAERRAQLLDLAVEGQIGTSIAIDKEHHRVIKEDLAKYGATLVQPSETLKAAQQQCMVEQTARVAGIAKKDRGIADAEQLAQTYVDVTAKWLKLSETIDETDPAQVKALFQREIYSKIDPATFGM